METKKRSNILIKLLLAVGIFLLADGLYVAVRTNLNAGTLLTLASGVFLILCSLFYKKLAELTSRGVLRVLKYLVLAGILFVICIMAFLAYYGHRDTVQYDEDAVIVLGAAVHGQKVSRSLGYRLEKAAEYAEKNPDALIIVSGGQGPQEAVTEASAMEEWLIRRGIPENRIIREEQASSTYENFQLSRKILDSRLGSGYTCAYVTNRYHTYRAGAVARQAGMDVQRLGAATDWYYLPASYLRETLALIKFWALGQ